jgi:hypothetical protein
MVDCDVQSAAEDSFRSLFSSFGNCGQSPQADQSRWGLTLLIVNLKISGHAGGPLEQVAGSEWKLIGGTTANAASSGIDGYWDVVRFSHATGTGAPKKMFTNPVMVS